MAKERVQVQGLGDVAPGIQPTIQRAGQYGIQVQKAGTNKLQQLAGALSQINPVLQQYGALQKQQEQIGIEEAALVEEQNVIAELKKQKDVDGFSLLATTNRDRAYRDALLKRHINNTMLPSLQSRADELLNPERYGDRNAFNQGLDEALKQEWDNLVTQVGDNIANTTAAKALWSSVTVPYKNKLALQHEQAIDKLIADEKLAEMGISFNALFDGRSVNKSEIEQVIRGYDDAIAGDLPQLEKKQRTAFLVQAVNQQANRLYADRRYTDADRLLQSVDRLKVNNVEIFNTVDSLKSLNDIRDKVNGKLFNLASADKESIDKEFRGAAGIAFKFIEGTSNLDELQDFEKEAILNTLRYLAPVDGDTEQERQSQEARIQDILQNEIYGQRDLPARAFLSAMYKLGLSNPDDGKPLMERNYNSLGLSLKNTQGVFAPTVNMADPKVKEKVLEEFTLKQEQEGAEGRTYTDKNFRSENPGIPVHPELTALSNRLNAGNYVRGLESYQKLETTLKNDLTSVIESLSTSQQDKLGSRFLDAYVGQSAKAIRNKALKYVADLAAEGVTGQAQVDAVNNFISEETKKDRELFTEVTNAASKRLTKITPISPQTIEEFEKLKEKEREKVDSGFLGFMKDEIEYPSLVPQQATGDQIKTDLEKAYNNSRKQDAVRATTRHRKILGGLLFENGFSEYDSENYKYLKEAGLKYDDVRLVANAEELTRLVIDEWGPVVYKIEQRLDLSKYEEDVWEDLQNFGVYDVSDLNLFLEAQTTLLKNYKR